MTSCDTPDILITPIGSIPDELVTAVATAVQTHFGLNTHVKNTLTDLEFALDPERCQYHSTRILEALQHHRPMNTVKIIALVPVDLFIPILTHVYGEAQLGGNACIVSTYRLKQELSIISPKQELIQRLIKEVFHELGHTFNLLHCKDPSCLMHYCRSIRDVDQKSESFCRYCEVLLNDAYQRLSITRRH